MCFRKSLTLFSAVLLAMGTGCSSEGADSTGGGDAKVASDGGGGDVDRFDTALDVAEPMDTDESETSDATDVGDSSETDGGYNARRRTLENNSFRDLEFIDDSYAVANGSVDRGIDGRSIDYDWIKLYDVSDPSSIEVADVRIFDLTSLETTAFDGGVLVARADFAEEEVTRGDIATDRETRFVDSNLVYYSIENGTLAKSAEYQGEDDEPPFTGYPRSFISNGERRILATGGTWYSIGFEEDLTGIEYPAVEQKFERTNDAEGPRDPLFAGCCIEMLSDGSVLEMWEGVAIWSFGRPDSESKLVGETIVEGALNHLYSAYAPGSEHFYIPPSLWGGTGGTSTGYVFDVSDRENPELAATWEVGEEMMELEGVPQTAGFEVIGDRLYWSVSGRVVPQLRVFDISEPATAEHLATWKWDELPLPSEHEPVGVRDLVSDGETLYINYEASEPPDLPAQTVVGVDPATLEP